MKRLNLSFHRLVATSAVMAGLFFSLSGQAVALDPGYRPIDADNTLVIDTTKGRIIVEMYPNLAPNHVERMKILARQHFYDGLKFHRVLEGFMAQTGDPKGTGEGGSSMPDLAADFSVRRDATFNYTPAARPRGSVTGFVGAMAVQTQPDEMLPLTQDGKVKMWGLFCQGTLGMARSEAANSANSQFFLMRAVNTVLDTRYTAFGRVLSGLDVVRKLKPGEPPKEPDIMTRVQVMSDMPAADRPKLEVIDLRSAEFKAELERVRKKQGADFSVCDVNVASKFLP